MDLELDNQTFIVCGSSSGFGRAIAEQLLEEGASVIAVARRKEKLEELQQKDPSRVQIIEGDLTKDQTLEKIVGVAAETESLHGLVVNAGGPPAMSALETSMEDWDEAYELVMRWKIDVVKRVLPLLQKYHYGRILFVESQSVKQPVTNLVLSNAFRAGVVGFAKTLSREIASEGITVNVLAPGSHSTPAIERVIQKESEVQNISYEQARAQKEESIPVGRMGRPEEIASLATWLLSSHASFVTGQTISHDGGVIKGLFG